MSKMNQPQNVANWVIQGTNGQPQMVKLVESSGKAIGELVSAGNQSLKIFKPTSITGEASQIFVQSSSSPQAQIIRNITTNNSNIVTKQVPVYSLSNIPKGTKIRLTQAQMQNIKISHNQQQMFSIQQNSTTSQSIPVIQQSSIHHSSQPIKNISPSILSRKRIEPGDNNVEYAPENKRLRKSEKFSRGLRHFSMKVCEKVKEKVTTSYNEVADDLVREFTNQQSSTNSPMADQYDQKNIRRRVYDALNVLMAMNIISKEKKEIRWIGLPTNSAQECHQLEKEVQRKKQSIREKERQFHELIMNQIAFKSLAQRNKESEKAHGNPGPNTFIQLPFIVVNTKKKSVINCSISKDKTEYVFEFNDKFEISDDLEVLKQMGMLHGLDNGKCSKEDLERIKQLIPQSLWPYVERLASGSKDPLEDMLESGTASTSSMHSMSDFVETTLEEDNSRQSSSNEASSPIVADYSEEEGDSEIDSDDLN